MPTKMIVCTFSLLLLGSAIAQNDATNKLIIPEFKTTAPQTLQARLAANVSRLKFDFNKAKDFRLPPSPESAPAANANCYTMRSYLFDRSEPPKSTGVITCTDSKLARKQEVEENLAPAKK